MQGHVGTQVSTADFPIEAFGKCFQVDVGGVHVSEELLARRLGDVAGSDRDGISHADACGATPVGGLLIAAQRRGIQITTLNLQNSGDTAGGKEQVVGYGSWSLQD